MGYLIEDKHVGNQEYITTGIDFNRNENTHLSFKAKKNFAYFHNLTLLW